MNGILWILRTRARWKDLPDRYPSYQTCHRRFQQWVNSGVFDHRLQVIADDLLKRGQPDLSECFISTAPLWSPKRGCKAGTTRRGKGTKIMAIADSAGLPLAVHVESAAPHEVTLVESTVAACFVDEQPERLIGDKAYDSDPLDDRLADNGIELIAPHRRNRTKPKIQDGRPLLRYKRRWKVERLIAWLQNFHRVIIRYEYYPENYKGFVQLGCLVILFRQYA